MTNRKSTLLIWVTYLYIISLPFFGFSLLNLWGRGIARPDWIFGFILIGLIALHLAINRTQLNYSPVNKFVLLFLYTALLSIINLFDASSAQFVDFGTKALQLLLVFAVFFVISNLPVDETVLLAIIRIWILMAFVTSIYAIYQLFARLYGLPYAYLTLTNPTIAEGGMSSRDFYKYSEVSGFLREPGFLGSYLIGPAIFSMVTNLRGKTIFIFSKVRSINWIIVGVIILAILLSGSLGPYFTLTATLIFMLLSNKIERTKTIKIILLIVILLFISGLILLSLEIEFLSAISYRLQSLYLNIRNPLGTPEVTSFQNRWEHTQAALKVWLSRPLLGVGLNNLSYYTNVTDRAHNPWVQLLADQGLLGFIALILVFLSLLKGLNNLHNENRLTPFWSVLVLSIIFVLISDIIDGIFSFNWVHPLRWFTLSLANLIFIRAHAISHNTDLQIQRQ